MLRKLFQATKMENKVDADGVPFRHIEGTREGHKVEINFSKYGIAARKDGDSKTTRANMDNNGLLDWFKSMFEG